MLTNIDHYYDKSSLRILKKESKSNVFMVKVLPPSGLIDPFKSYIEGTLNEKDSTTIINLMVRPNWVISLFALPFFFPMMTLLDNLNFQDFTNFIKSFLISIIAVVFPFIFIRLKVFWDSKRVRKIIENELITAPNNG